MLHVRICVRPTVVNWYFIEMTGRIELVLAWRVSFASSVHLLDITVSCAKMVELIEVSFWLWTWVGPRNRV